MKKIFFFLLLPIISIAQKNHSQELDRYMEAQMNVKGFSGAVLVMEKNHVLLRKAYGLADREWNVPNTPETRFCIGSMTEQFTAASILQLEEQGKISPEDRLSKFIPGFPKGEDVTIHMLLNHTSGIAAYSALPDFVNLRSISWSKDSIIDFIEKSPFDFSPGAQYRYSNSGYFLLGCILEKVSGQSYNEFLSQHIFDKLGMANTGISRPDSILSMRARGYSKSRSRYLNADYLSPLLAFRTGLLYSTLDDLYKWDRALYGQSILDEASKQKMLVPEKGDYGYGIKIDSVEKHLRIGHNSAMPGFLSNISRFVNEDVCIIILANDEIILSNTLPITHAIADGLANIVFNLPVEVPYIHKEVKIDPALLDRYVGKYKAFLTLEVIKKDGRLYRHREGSPDIELKPESETKFFYNDDSDRQLEFEVDKSGKVIKIWFINSEQRGEMQRVP